MKWLVLGAALLAGAVAWMVVNPMRGFGVGCYGLAVYDMIPIPAADFAVRSTGQLKFVPRTHDLSVDDLAWLIEDRPETLIIATGWAGALKPQPQILAYLQTYDVRPLKTGEAQKLYNELLDEGRRVAIYHHSTD